MASGHVNRIKRPNTWLHRPMLQNREESSCQTGAVHTCHIASCPQLSRNGRGPEQSFIDDGNHAGQHRLSR
jgi:hypothetical protein